MADHARRSSPESCPLLHSFMAMDMDERWVNRSPERMLETFHWFRGEGFDMIVEDLLDLPRDPGIIVEGFRLLPALVEPFLSDPRRAVWLLPTPAFRAASQKSDAPLFLDLWHPSAAGHRVAAEALAAELTRQGLVPAS